MATIKGRVENLLRYYMGEDADPVYLDDSLRPAIERICIQVRAAALEEAAKAAEHWGTFYPTSVFPEDGTSVDCISAGMGRQAAEQIAAAIRALKEQEE